MLKLSFYDTAPESNALLNFRSAQRGVEPTKVAFMYKA